MTEVRPTTVSLGLLAGRLAPVFPIDHRLPGVQETTEMWAKPQWLECLA